MIQTAGVAKADMCERWTAMSVNECADIVDVFNKGDEKAMAGACADPMQILDGMSRHVWQGPTASQDWWSDVLTEGEHVGASGYRITLGEPGHVDVTAITRTSLFPQP